MRHTLNSRIKSKAQVRKRKQRREHRPFPYLKVARMWAQGKTIAQIARSINRVDTNNPEDPHHSLRNFLHLMHGGYRNGNGRIVRLPYRVSAKTVRSSRQAGLRAAR